MTADKEIIDMLLHIEIARTNNGEIIGLRITRDKDVALIFKNWDGIRVGDKFPAKIGEEIIYKDAEL